MPTAAKLFAAMVLAGVGALAAWLVLVHASDNLRAGFLPVLAAVVGIVGGWRVIGRQAGRGYTGAAAMGLQGVIYMVFWVLVLVSTAKMLTLAWSQRYKSPMEAVVDIFGQGIGYAQLMNVPSVIMVLILGGMMAGLVSEWAGRRWR